MEQITLDMIPNSHTPIAHISQYDSGRHIRFNLQNITLTGSETVTLKIRKADGELVSKIIENHTSYVEYVSEKADCDVSGKANCEIVISKDDVVIGSKNFIMKVEADAYDGAGVITKTASGAIATFETNIADVLQSLKCEINASGGNGTPDNPIPIVGHSELNLTKCGANLLAYSPISQNVSITGGEGDFTITSGSSSGFACAFFNITNLKGLGTFYFSGEGERSQSYSSLIAFQLVYVDGSGSYHFDGLGYYDNNNKCNVTNIAFALSDDIEFAYLQCYVNNTGDDSRGKTANFKNIIISTAPNSNFEHYNGQAFTVAFGQTVYGGVYDKSGRLTITHGIKDLGTLNFIYDSDVPRFWTGEITDIKRPSTTAIVISGLADIYKVVSFDDLYYRYKKNGTLACSSAGVVSIINTAYTDVSTFKTAMSGHYFCYELATPIVIDVQAISPSAVVGTNNVFGDTGDTEVKYLYIA